jgi:hypothetical protein
MELVKSNGSAVAQASQPVESAGAAMLQMIAQAARDPQVDVGKMRELLEMRERIMEKEAEIAFNQAMSRLQPRLPVIAKKGKVKVKDETRSSFARYEDIDVAIKPLLCEEGFSLSFGTQTLPDGQTEYTGTLAHALGHKQSESLKLPPDDSGSKNKIQAIGSTVSYARRYLVCMLLNIVTREEDDDAQSIGYVTQDQALNVHTMIADCQMDADSKSRFLKYMGVTAIENIPAKAYGQAMNALQVRLRKNREGK